MLQQTVPDYSHLKTFGCVAYAHQVDSKFDSRSLKCVFLSYGEWVKGYRLWLKEGKGFKVIIGKSIVFNEDVFPYLGDINGDKITDNDFVMTEIEFKSKNTLEQI